MCVSGWRQRMAERRASPGPGSKTCSAWRFPFRPKPLTPLTDMRIIIVDDEALARSVLQEYLRHHADIEVIAECANGFEAVKAITELEPDLVFLDIQMPKLDGFEVIGLTGAKSRFIFVTAYDQYAIKAFEIHAVDYLLKPFSQQRLDDALKHARDSLGEASAIDDLVSDAATRNQPLERLL